MIGIECPNHTKTEVETLTDRERAIVMAYTGYVMLSNDKMCEFLDYVYEVTGKRISFDDMKYKVVSDEIRKCATKDFISLCN